MREFLEFILGSLVDHPDEVKISYRQDGKKHYFLVAVHPEDVGKLIGKRGFTISAIRNLMVASASRQGETVSVKVERDGEE